MSAAGAYRPSAGHMHDQDSLTRHLNAEVAAGYMDSLHSAAAWLKSTFLFVRVKSNPAYYKLPRGLTDDELEERLRSICMRDVRKLAAAEMIQLEDDGRLRPLQLGTIMARHCIVRRAPPFVPQCSTHV